MTVTFYIGDDMQADITFPESQGDEQANSNFAADRLFSDSIVYDAKNHKLIKTVNSKRSTWRKDVSCTIVE